jgi:hypothetical protein
VLFGANMNAILEAAKIGINANMAHNYNADSFVIQNTYDVMSSIISAFRQGK